jgi:Fic family protein
MLFATPPLDDRESEVLAEIEDLKKKLRWQLSEPRRWTGSLRRLSFARNIRGSNSIEGYDAALDDAAAVALGEEPLDTSTETRLALEGYRNAMTYVLQLVQEPPVEPSEQLIKSLHFMMTSYSLANRPGRWRAGDIYVRDDESGDIVHEGADVDDVPTLMTEFVGSLSVRGDEAPLITAAMAHLNLVMIHPFRDGNGRMARCLQSLVLAGGGTLSPVFMSVEEYLGRNTQRYYDVLAEVGAGAWNPGRDARPWIRFMLTAHLRQALTLQRRTRESERMWSELERLVADAGLPERVIALLFDATLGLRVRKSTYRAILADSDDDVSDPAATRDLRQAVDAGLLTAHGEKRGRFYTRSDRLLALRDLVVSAREPTDARDPFMARPGPHSVQPSLF